MCCWGQKKEGTGVVVGVWSDWCTRANVAANVAAASVRLEQEEEEGVEEEVEESLMKDLGKGFIECMPAEVPQQGRGQTRFRACCHRSFLNVRIPIKDIYFFNRRIITLVNEESAASKEEALRQVIPRELARRASGFLVNRRDNVGRTSYDL